jgi:putative phosphoribosyl transferase
MSTRKAFSDRSEAGRQLAATLGEYAGRRDTIVLALPRGGVPVAAEVARRLELPLDVLVTARLSSTGQEELALYRRGEERPDVRGLTVVLVDDGLATGASVRTAVAAARKMGAARVVVAVPVVASDTCTVLRREADEVRCLVVPSLFRAVSDHYETLDPLSDDEVRRVLEGRIETAP